jgi:predicted AAA+ superfamily ATPase
MLQRFLQSEILNQLRRSPAVVLLGPRQVGKTTLARHIAAESGRPSLYLDLERPSDLAKLSDPELYLREQHGKLVILDEIQRLPSGMRGKRPDSFSFSAPPRSNSCKDRPKALRGASPIWISAR